MYRCLNPGCIGVKLPWAECLPLARDNGFEGVGHHLWPARLLHSPRGGHGRRSSVVVVGSAALLAIALAGRAQAGQGENLVANGDFAKTSAGAPVDWASAGDSHVTQRLEAAKDADGRPYARLACTRFDQRSPASHAMLAQVGKVRLVQGRLYEFSCRVRTDGLKSRSIHVAVSDTATWTNCGLNVSLPTGKTWRTHRRFFTATRTVGESTRLQFWFNETGTLDVADVHIAETRAEDAEFTDVVPPAGGRNLVRNGSFEVGPAGWSSLGTQTGWGNLSRLHGSIKTQDAAHGRSFLRIPLGGDRTPVLHFDYYEPLVRRELAPLAAGRGWIKVERGKPYTLSCMMRAGRGGVRALLGVRDKRPGGGHRDHTQPVTLTTEWKRYTMTFRPLNRYVFVLAGPDLEKEEPVHVDLDAVQLQEGEQATAFEPRQPVEVALEPTAPAGIFAEGERGAALRLAVCNHSAADAKVEVAFKVTDYFDGEVPWRGETVEAPARTVVGRNLQLPPSWKGYYRVLAIAKAADAAETIAVPLAVVPKPAGDDTVLGINHAFTTPHLIRLASKVGVAWFRDWSLKWNHIEPERGRFTWERGDAQIDRVLALGPKVLCLLPPFPSADWISEAPADLPTKGYPGSRLRSAWAPRDPNELARYVGQCVARYKDRMKVWEFLNEPIYTDYALPSDKGNRYGGRNYAPADYVALLKTASAAMKKADPGCKVIGGIGSGAMNLTRETIEAGALEHLDIFNLHFYPGSRLPEGYAAEMDKLLALMDAAGRRLPIWITEFSYYGVDNLPRRPFIPVSGSWSENRLLESERDCADRTVRFFAVMLSKGVEKIFIHSGASGEVNQPSFECALFDHGGVPRKLAPAMAVLTHLLGPAPVCEGARPFGETGHAAAFRAERHGVVILWKDDPDADLRLVVPPTPGLQRLDLMGRPQPPGPIDLSTSPGYLVGPPGQAKQILESIRVGRP